MTPSRSEPSTLSLNHLERGNFHRHPNFSEDLSRGSRTTYVKLRRFNQHFHPSVNSLKNWRELKWKSKDITNTFPYRVAMSEWINKWSTVFPWGIQQHRQQDARGMPRARIQLSTNRALYIVFHKKNSVNISGNMSSPDSRIPRHNMGLHSGKIRIKFCAAVKTNVSDPIS